MCQKTVLKKQHPCSEKCTCFDDTDDDQESENYGLFYKQLVKL